MTWPLVPLGGVATPVERFETPTPGKMYRQLGVRLWGEGAYEREAVDGGVTKYAALNRFEADDLVVNKIWARNGSVAVVSGSLAGCYGSGEFPAFEIDRARLEPRWMHWLTKSSGFWAQCDEQSRGTSGQNRIRPEKFLAITIPLPPLPEQQRIVARVDAIATRVAAARRLREEVAADADRVLVQMAHRADLSEDAKREAGWRQVALAEVLTQTSDAVTVDTSGEYPNFGIYSFARGLFEKPPISGLETSATALYRARAGQFIYSRLFAFEGSYGRVTPEFDGQFVSAEYPMFDCEPGAVRAEFLAAYFKAKHVWAAVALGSKGLGDRRQRVQPPQLLAHRVWLPPMPWQDRLAATWAKADALRAQQAAVGDELDALLPSVLNRAFAGGL